MIQAFFWKALTQGAWRAAPRVSGAHYHPDFLPAQAEELTLLRHLGEASGARGSGAAALIATTVAAPAQATDQLYNELFTSNWAMKPQTQTALASSSQPVPGGTVQQEAAHLGLTQQLNWEPRPCEAEAGYALQRAPRKGALETHPQQSVKQEYCPGEHPNRQTYSYSNRSRVKYATDLKAGIGSWRLRVLGHSFIEGRDNAKGLTLP